MGTEDVIMEFDVMHRDTVCTHVKLKSNMRVEFENFTDNIVRRAFGISDTVTVNRIEEFFEDRCFPKTRANCDEVLKTLGLKKYDPYDIVKITHGALVHDFRWIRFKGETLTWDDICRTWRSQVRNR